MEMTHHTAKRGKVPSVAPAVVVTEDLNTPKFSVRLTHHWWVRIAVILLLTVPFQYRVWHWLPFTGDEPHYLLTSISIINDFDVDLANNYRETGRMEEFGNRYLSPQGPSINDPHIPPPHGVGFPILLAAIYSVLGLTMTQVVLVCIATATCLLVAAVCDAWGLKPIVGTSAVVILATSPTWQLHASRLYPECVAGCLSIAALLLAQRCSVSKAPLKLSPLWAGVIVGYLPFLYLKYSSIALVLLAYCLYLPRLRRSAWFYAGLFASWAFWVVTQASIYGPHLAAGSGGNFSSFSHRGMFDRASMALFDKAQGLVPYQPAYLLILWAVPSYLVLRRGRRAGGPLAAAALAVFAYALTYALFLGSPGESMPGRYYCAALPLMALLIAAWVFDGPYRRIPQDSAAVLVAVGALFLIVSFWQGLAPWDILRHYRDTYAHYWSPASFTATPVSSPPLPAATIGLWFMLIVVVSKVICRAAATFTRVNIGAPPSR
jgi:hypothetical protein